MENKEALAFIEEILAPRKLSYIEELVVIHTWDDMRYREMALKTGYEEGYLKDTGSRLWQLLSETLGYRVTKKRLRYICTEIAQSQGVASPSSVSSPPPANAATQPPGTAFHTSPDLEYPGSPLSFQSPRYIERPPVEALAASALQSPGGLLRIKAPWRMGKTSLMNHLLGQCRQLDYQTVMIDIRQVDAAALTNLDTFLRWFCWSISQQLNLSCDLEQYWFDDAGSKLNCTTYIQAHILPQIDSALVVAIDTGHYLVKHPDVATNFFAMLRAWFEQARVRPQWQKLRLMLAHVTDLDLPLQVYQSPFNVGLLVELPSFNLAQVHQLRDRYNFDSMSDHDAAALASLCELVGGHPYLVQLALYWRRSGQLSFAQILQTAATNEGIYREYLRRLWSVLQEDDALVAAFYQVLDAPAPLSLNPEQAYALADMGLVNLIGHQVGLRCDLYRAYFDPLLKLKCG